MKIATINGVNKKHHIYCDPPALRKEDIEPEISGVFVGVAYAVMFTIIIFYIGLSIWHMMQ